MNYLNPSSSSNSFCLASTKSSSWRHRYFFSLELRVAFSRRRGRPTVVRRADHAATSRCPAGRRSITICSVRHTAKFSSRTRNVSANRTSTNTDWNFRRNRSASKSSRRIWSEDLCMYDEWVSHLKPRPESLEQFHLALFNGTPHACSWTVPFSFPKIGDLTQEYL